MLPSTSTALASKVMFVPANCCEPLSGSASVTVGGRLLMVTTTGAEVATLIQLSNARAVRGKTPRVALLHTNEYGAVVSSPSLFAPAKNSTRRIQPSGSAVLAAMLRFTGPRNEAPL